ncbi:glycosyltransferase family 2 protein [Methylorubrum thiocyanatum]|uniref:F5/8 type C domain-containing protein n=1 Tax=Methylorubrum thiocyanatum TaxID=47958 RepID=A0AA40RZZ3_9HYPH|nr:glycosyltransferase family 92 protein [Methylorubrum thiocyanatum]MBA8912056.1 hypothetical protein [Methylorubrum thiocyanatum]
MNTQPIDIDAGGGRTKMAKHQFSIIACARWETEHVVEWLTYHSIIGFDHVYLYCNDDDPTELYTACLPFIASGFVTFHHYPYQGQQYYMYMDCLRKYKNDSEWVFFLDVDEFLCLKNINNISEFMKSQDTDILHFNWAFFGPGEFETRPHGSVLLQYTRRQNVLHTGTKVMMRTDIIDIDRFLTIPGTGFWHFVNTEICDGRRTNVLGDDWTHIFDDYAGITVPTVNNISEKVLSIASIYHYGIKSKQDFIRRAQRGLSGQFATQTAWKSWHDTGHADHVIRTLSDAEDLYLRDFWRETVHAGLATDTSPPKPAGCHNVALGKNAAQSSVSEWSIHPSIERDASGANNGKITGLHNFHTNYGLSWWEVDLGSEHEIVEIRIFNRMDHARVRFKDFYIEFFLVDGTCKRIEFKDEYVGGVDCRPFILKLEERAHTIRIGLLENGYLSLDEVEVYAREDKDFHGIEELAVGDTSASAKIADA